MPATAVFLDTLALVCDAGNTNSCLLVRPKVWRLVGVGALLLVMSATTGCTGGADERQSEPSMAAPSSARGAALGSREGCVGSTDYPAGTEVRGTITDGDLWAMIFASAPFEAQTPTKIAWRMTGFGALSITATLGDKTQVTPLAEPEQHGGSTWSRPGQEFGSVFVFPAPGCWKFVLRRDGGSTGVVWFPVEAPVG